MSDGETIEAESDPKGGIYVIVSGLVKVGAPPPTSLVGQIMGSIVQIVIQASHFGTNVLWGILVKSARLANWKSKMVAIFFNMSALFGFVPNVFTCFIYV